MSRWLSMAALATLAAGCDFTFTNPHLEGRGLTEEYLKAPPGGREIKAAVVNDIRERRALHLALDEGRREAPAELKFDKYGVEATRAKDGQELWRIVVKEDPIDLVHAVNEYAYWDREQYVYYYHYEGGNPHRDVWMGPFQIKFAKPPEDEE